MRHLITISTFLLLASFSWAQLELDPPAAPTGLTVSLTPIEKFNIGATTIAIVSSLVAVLSGYFFGALTLIKKGENQKSVKDGIDSESRLTDARLEKKKAHREAQVNRLISVLTTVSQYIVGGVLSTSFVQENISYLIVGGLGVGALIATLTKQHFQPEKKLQLAQERLANLNSFIRDVEDEIFELGNEEISREQIIPIRRKVSAFLSRIDYDRYSEIPDTNEEHNNPSQQDSAGNAG